MNSNELTVAPTTLVQDQQAQQLATRARGGDNGVLTPAKRKELEKVSQDFESLFIGMMMKSMRDTVPKDKLFGEGNAEETYRYLLDQQYSTLAAQRGGIGIAAMVEKQLLQRYQTPAPSAGSGDKQ